jgi:SecD/SecF fusion protein
LPGIAGIVLTMGTAVDANIIIYERAKEELRAVKRWRKQLKHPIAGEVLCHQLQMRMLQHFNRCCLFIFGSGPIKGFATTLLIGIITSLFTSILSRIFIDLNISKEQLDICY